MSQARVTLEDVDDTTRRFLGGGGGFVGSRRRDSYGSGGTFIAGIIYSGDGFGVLGIWLHITAAHRKIGV